MFKKMFNTNIFVAVFCRSLALNYARRRVHSFVCPSHAGSASKLMTVGSCSFLHGTTQGIV